MDLNFLSSSDSAIHRYIFMDFVGLAVFVCVLIIYLTVVGGGVLAHVTRFPVRRRRRGGHVGCLKKGRKRDSGPAPLFVTGAMFPIEITSSVADVEFASPPRGGFGE